jgi:serine/threonine protein kinase
VTAFEREVAILKKLRDPGHAHVHLITLLATYKHGMEYNLIFPWADTDLFGYWKQFQCPHQGGHLANWVIEQCRGLAEGLNRIHRYETLSGASLLKAFMSERHTETTVHRSPAESTDLNRAIRTLFGRHGDIKPKNILWYPDSHSTGGHGVLKIADFGVTRFSTDNTWDTRKTGRMPHTLSYRSPENDLDGTLSTACDVWALGCVYLEFITWYFGGYKYLKQFGKKRLAVDRYLANIETDTFFTIQEQSGTKKAEVKPAVLEVSLSFLSQPSTVTGNTATTIFDCGIVVDRTLLPVLSLTCCR